MEIEKPKIRSIGRPYCKDQIVYLLKINNGSMSRYDLREEVISMGYGSEGFRQALLTLIRQGTIITNGSSKSPKNQMIILNIAE